MVKQLYIAYYRVSTEEQGKTGLGLSAQKKAVTTFVNENGILVGEFQDIESGTSETRQGMMEAIEACEQYNAVLVVKEMSRISRGGYMFRDMLDRANIDFIECDSPHDPEVVKDIKFSLAKEERKKISRRTKDALSEIKGKIDRGEAHYSKSGRLVMSLGSPKNLTDEAREKSARVRSQKALNNINSKQAGAFIVVLRKAGKTYKIIADALNEAGFSTVRGNTFKAMTAKRLYERYV